MNKLYLYLPYVIIFDVMAFLFFKYYNPNNILTLLIPIVGIILLFYYLKFQQNLDDMIDSQLNKFFLQDRYNFINSYNIPSVIIYRVKKHHDCSSEDIKIAQAELKILFKHHLSDLNSKRTNGVHSVLKTAIAYEILHEFTLSNDLYNNFCNKAFGSYYKFSKFDIEKSTQLNKELFPHLHNSEMIL